MCALNNSTRSKSITVLTIARLVGVSAATVSRALSGKKKDGKLLTKPETLKKIKQVCSELNYKPNILARAFVTQKSKTIAAVGFSDERYFFNRLAIAQNVALNKGYNLNVTMLNRSKTIDDTIEQMFNIWKYDGVWIVGSGPQFQEKMVQHCAGHSVPITFTGQPIGCQNKPNVKCVGANMQKGFADLIDYLLSLGHRRFAWLIPNLKSDILAKWYYNYIQMELEKNHIPKEDIHIIETSHDMHLALKNTTVGVQKIKQTIKKENQPTVAISIWRTMAHLHGIQEAGLSVPDDISFITLDYSIKEFGDLLRPAVAALYEPPVISAQKSISSLIGMIEDIDQAGSIPFEYIPLEMEFKQNASCISII
jgi:LacI family transcriptional regulator, galactose operon repressor